MGIKFLMQKDNMNTKIFSKLILITMLFAASPQLIASASDSISADSSVSKNVALKHAAEKYFKKFAASVQTDHVKYANKTRTLILFANPKAMNDLINAFLAFLSIDLSVLSAAGCYLMGKEFIRTNNTDAMVALLFFGLSSPVGLLIFVHLCRKIINNYKMRNSFTPYLTFDSKGLQVFNEDKLKWKDVDRVNFDGASSIYLDKDVKELFKFSISDNNIPVSYEQVKWIFKHCLSKYGNDKFKSTRAQVISN